MSGSERRAITRASCIARETPALYAGRSSKCLTSFGAEIVSGDVRVANRARRAPLQTHQEFPGVFVERNANLMQTGSEFKSIFANESGKTFGVIELASVNQEARAVITDESKHVAAGCVDPDPAAQFASEVIDEWTVFSSDWVADRCNTFNHSVCVGSLAIIHTRPARKIAFKSPRPECEAGNGVCWRGALGSRVGCSQCERGEQ